VAPGPASGRGLSERVTAMWLMLAGKGEREGLTFLERAFGFGFETRAAPSGPGVWLTLNALKDRVVRVGEQGGCPVAVTSIGGHDGVLKHIYVKASDGFFLPSVEYVEIFGADPGTGAELYEKVVPGKR
jgi:hypothetical protein